MNMHCQEAIKLKGTLTLIFIFLVQINKYCKMIFLFLWRCWNLIVEIFKLFLKMKMIDWKVPWIVKFTIFFLHLTIKGSHTLLSYNCLSDNFRHSDTKIVFLIDKGSTFWLQIHLEFRQVKIFTRELFWTLGMPF
jgi:hypothetical protein